MPVIRGDRVLGRDGRVVPGLPLSTPEAPLAKEPAENRDFTPASTHESRHEEPHQIGILFLFLLGSRPIPSETNVLLQPFLVDC